MTRSQALAMSRQIKRLLHAFEDQPQTQAGVLATALMLGEIVASDGKIEERVWLRAAGIHPKTFRTGRGKLELHSEDGDLGEEQGGAVSLKQVA